MLQWRNGPKLRVLDFDIENRPLSYLGMDYTTAEITAIAASWEGQTKVHTWLLGENEPLNMLCEFVELYDAADIVTGHYIVKHDLPVLNGALLELELPLLEQKMVSDTKLHIPKSKYMSLSQENLAALYQLSHKKEHMNQVQWREANRLTSEGLRETRRRVAGDVRQHKALRQRLIENGALKPPTLWRP